MIISDVIEGIFVDRPNRFTVVFKVGKKTETAHLKDPGRLKELLIPKSRLLLKHAIINKPRKTKYDVIAVLKDNLWVVINSGIHSYIASDLIESREIDEFSNFFIEKKEYSYGKSRIDFFLSTNGKKFLVEVKGCTLVEDGVAMFPDAPTERGRKHVEELIKAKKEGLNSAVLFLIMREDANNFTPNYKMDPEFSFKIKEAYQEGVEVIAYSFKNIYNKNKLEIKPFKRIKITI
jgi:sugar fermentation stimulation protein A